jgi:hypothetical protein
MNARLARNDGFSTVAIMITLMLSSLLAVAAFATANNGTPLSRADQNEKEAYSAAEAGVAFYAFHLAQDPNYWTACTNPNPTAPLSPNPLWDGTSGTTRQWRPLPNPVASDVSHPPTYNITLLPSPGSTKCQPGLAGSTFLNPQTGTFSIRSTGQYRGHKRSIVATFKRKGFVDFLWFTDYETPDPLSYPPSQVATAESDCIKYARDGRPNNGNKPCEDQSFVDGDVVAGPMHTNDRFQTCGQPTFGSTANDAIEIVDPTGYLAACGPAFPNVKGTWLPGSLPLDFPSTNTALATDTLAGWNFTGTTHLVFHSGGAGTVDVTNAQLNGGATEFGLPLPANFVMYDSNQGNACGTTGYQYYQQYTDPAGCGDVWISGSYPRSLTVGAQNDIIINGNLTSSDPQAEMGLIASGFVRVYHPVAFGGSGTCDNTTSDATGAMKNIQIDAAILSLNHSFLVDNATCGDPEGTLTVNGAIAQKYRGTVGTHDNNGNIITGYTKLYTYDQNLRYADPPYFLDPVETSWNIVRETEQVPAQ